jgi:hypothetical protein
MNPLYSSYTTTEESLPVDIKLDGCSSQTITLSVDNPNTFSFNDTSDPKYFFQGAYYLIRFSIAGEKRTLRIPLKDSTVTGFLAQCQQVANSQKRKENEARENAGKEAYDLGAQAEYNYD